MCPVFLCFLRANEHSELRQKFELRAPGNWLRTEYHFIIYKYVPLTIYICFHQGRSPFILYLVRVSDQANSVSSLYCSTDVSTGFGGVNRLLPSGMQLPALPLDHCQLIMCLHPGLLSSLVRGSCNRFF